MPAPQPNALADVALTIVLPSLVLEFLSDPARLGPMWALVVSLVFPLGFGAWCWWKHAGWNVFSIIGLVTVLLSGGLGLLKLDAFWFAAKESVMPLALGAAFPLSHALGRPLLSTLMMQPHIVNRQAVQQALDTPEKRRTYQSALAQGSWWTGLAAIASSIGNFCLAMHLLGGREPGGEAFVKGIGTLNWASVIVIGVPLAAVLLLVFVWLIRRIQTITGLERADLLNPGRTVRRQVGP